MAHYLHIWCTPVQVWYIIYKYGTPTYKYGTALHKYGVLSTSMVHSYKKYGVVK